MCVQCVYNVYTICVLVFGGDFEVIRYYTIRGETQVACLKFLLLTKQIKNENTTAFKQVLFIIQFKKRFCRYFALSVLFG